ncbi:MAG TPA: enoyl-CoA hydratase-related protein [Caulobacteraceae bacterium]|nr:enoyl-CoA hydratase-related protein [Caulobacteraceae bacterium]
MSGHLLETIEDGVATLTMNRPEARNALTGEMQAGLSEALPRLAADGKVRAIVLTGAGGAFCAGGDVKGFAQRAAGPAEAGDNRFDFEGRVWGLRQSMDVVRLLHEAPKPTLAVIPGAAAGAGLSLALACDLRIATENAKLTTAFSKVGLSGDYGGSYFLTKLVGAAKARELYFTADVISGAEAARLGIVNHAVPEAELQAFALAYARRLANLPTLAVGYMKRNLDAALHLGLGEVLDLEATHMVRSFMTDDHKAAALAFVRKEAPVFAGR